MKAEPIAMRRLKFTAIAFCLSGTVASGQVVRPIGPAGAPRTVTSGVITKGVQKNAESIISGTAVDANATPLPNVTVRLRNLVNGEIERISTANQLGEFSFAAQAEIPYVVEIADQAGRILAVGNIISAQAGEVAGAIVALPMRLQAMAGVFGDTASSVVSAASGTGFTAIDANQQPSDSPQD